MDKAKNFQNSNYALQGILLQWNNGHEFNNEKMLEFARHAAIVYDTVCEIVNKSGVIDEHSEAQTN